MEKSLDNYSEIKNMAGLCFSAPKEDFVSVKVTVNGHLKRCRKSILLLKRNLHIMIDGCRHGLNRDFMSVLGTYGEETLDVAVVADIYRKYSELVFVYGNAICCIKTLIADFDFLKEYAKSNLKKYSMMLVDVFGDSVKLVAPELFDLNLVGNLQYANSLLDSIALEYDTLANLCPLLAENLKDFLSAENTLEIQGVFGGENPWFALAELNRYCLDPSNRITALKRELVLFIEKIRKDIFVINRNLKKISSIYKMLSELYIPKVYSLYCQVSDTLFAELEQLEDSVYYTVKLKELKCRREIVLEDCHSLINRILQDRINMDIYRTGIDSKQRLIEGSRDNYDETVLSRPLKPFFLLDILTFGISGKRYNRDLSEWESKYLHAVKFYEDHLVNMKMEQEELSKLEAGYSVNIAALRKYEAELSAVAKEIKPLLKVSGDIKAKVLTYLESVFKLLKAAKDIVSSELDERYMKVISFAEYKSSELPERMKSSLSKYTDMVRKEIYESSLVSGQVRSEKSLSD